MSMGLKLFENKSIEARKDETYPFYSHAIITVTDASTHTLLRHFMHKHTSSTSTARWAGSEVHHVETTPDLTEERQGLHVSRCRRMVDDEHEPRSGRLHRKRVWPPCIQPTAGPETENTNAPCSLAF